MGKIGAHVKDKFARPVFQGLKIGNEIAEKLPHGPLQPVALFGGWFAGSVVGAFKIWSPLDVVDTVMTSEEDLEKRWDDLK